jgi:hypothetical protein
MSSDVIVPIDPMAPVVDGRYADPLVVVEAVRGDRGRKGERTVRTAHFDFTPVDRRVHLAHVVPATAVDDDLAGLLHEELFGPGWLRGTDLSERVFTGVVRTSAEDALQSWDLFYRNTMRRLEDPGARAPCGDHGSIDGYAPVHDHALDLLGAGSVLELGCCFGFLALRIARSGRATTASDVSAGTVQLLTAIAPRLGVDLATETADAARYPAADGCADTVLAEALRLARTRVVVAVPLEEEADETYGHVRTVTLDDLHRWGRGTGCAYEVHELHGGWLVVDKRSGLRRSRLQGEMSA